MPTQIRFTEEEKQEDYKDILNMIKKNMTYKEIADAIGRSPQYVCIVKKNLIQEGLITQSEIDEIKEKARLEKERKIDKKVLSYLNIGYNRTEISNITKISIQDINASVIRLTLSGIDVSKFKSIADIKRKARRQKIKKLIKKGYYRTQITEKTNIPLSTVSRITRELIQEGVVKEKQVKVAINDIMNKTEKRNNEIRKELASGVSIDEISEKYNLCSTSIFNIQNNKKIVHGSKVKKKDYDVVEIDDNLNELDILVLNYLKKGYSYVTIRKLIGKDQTELMKIVAKLKKGKYITQTIINEAQEKRKEFILTKIKSLLKQGYSQADIIRELNQEVEEVTSCFISRMVSNFISTGDISKEEIKKAIDDTNSSYKSVDAKVLSYLKEGLTVKEMIEADEDGYLTESRVRRSKKRLIESGQITEKEILKYQKQKEKAEKDKAYKEEEKLIWHYIIKEGLTNLEISEKLGFCLTYVNARVLCIRKRKKLSLKDIYQIRKKVLLKIEEERELLKSKEEKNKNDLLASFYEAKRLLIKCINNGIDKENVYSSYFDLFQKIVKNNLNINNDEVDLLASVVLYSKTYCSFIHASYVIDVYLRLNEKDKALKFLNMYNAEYKLAKNEYDNEKTRIRNNKGNI